MFRNEKKESEKVFFLVGRDNWQKDASLNQFLLNYLKTFNGKIIWEDPASAVLLKLYQLESKIQWLPPALKKLNRKVIRFCYALFHWEYFGFLKALRQKSIPLRCKNLEQKILKLPFSKDIILIGRSSGGRVASLVADKLNLKHVICLSYPFEHPKMGIEPERFLHLENLKTPMLIIQGMHDVYGGVEVQKKYILSPAIDIIFVDTDHDFNLNEDAWKSVLGKISTTIN